MLDATTYLREKGLLKEGQKRFIITQNLGRPNQKDFDVCELLEDFHKRKLEEEFNTKIGPQNPDTITT